MPRVKSSAVWNFFQPKPDSNGLAVCKLCKNALSYRATSNNLRRHLQRKHPFVIMDSSSTQEISVIVENAEEVPTGYPESMELDLQMSEPTDITEEVISAATIKYLPEQSPVDTFLKIRPKVSTAKDMDNALLRLFTIDFQPFSIVEDKGFIRFVKTLNPSYQLPTRKKIENSLLPAAYEEAYNASINILDDIPSITVTIDCWTTSNTENFISITGHYVNNNFENKSILLECSSIGDSYTRVNLNTTLNRVITEWNLHAKVLVIISNGAANVTKAITDLKFNHFGCFAHKLNSIAQDALKLITNSLDKVKILVGHFKRSTFTNEQKQMHISLERLVQSVPTRWNSTFYMLERFVELEEALRTAITLIDKKLPVITPEEWHYLGEIVKILKPLEAVTNFMSGEKYLTASSVIILTDGLVDVYSNLDLNFTESAKDVINCILNGLSDKLGDLERNESLVLTTFLDPRFKNIGFSNEVTANMAKEQIVASLTQMILDKNEDVTLPVVEADNLEDSIWRKFDKKIASSNPGGTAHSKAIVEVQRYLEEPPIPRNEDPLLWWRNNASNLPNLSEMMKFKFIPVATSVPCDWLFTKSGQLLSERRLRFNSSDVKSILFLHTMDE